MYLNTKKNSRRLDIDHLKLLKDRVSDLPPKVAMVFLNRIQMDHFCCVMSVLNLFSLQIVFGVRRVQEMVLV